MWVDRYKDDDLISPVYVHLCTSRSECVNVTVSLSVNTGRAVYTGT
jgi:hypothetical protein